MRKKECSLFELVRTPDSGEPDLTFCCEKFGKTEILSICDEEGYETSRIIFHNEDGLIVAFIDRYPPEAKAAIRCKEKPKVKIGTAMNIECGDNAAAVWL